MKTIALSIASTALLMGLGLAAFAQPRGEPMTIEGKDHSILLARMTVTATPLPD